MPSIRVYAPLRDLPGKDGKVESGGTHHSVIPPLSEMVPLYLVVCTFILFFDRVGIPPVSTNTCSYSSG